MDGSISFEGLLHGSIAEGGGGGSNVIITPVVTSGTKIADVSVDGVEKDLYCPTPPTPPTPQEVIITPVVTEGTKIADVSIDGVEKDLYCPTPPTPTEIEVTQIQTSGTKIASIEVNGNTTDIYSPNNDGHSYSTNEQIVGVWVDGRPVYEKTIIVNSPSGAGRFDLVTLDSNIDLIISQSAFMYSNNYIRFLPYTDIGNYDTNIYFNLPTLYLTVDNDSWADYQLYITIQYTKSTDTPTRELLLLDFS